VERLGRCSLSVREGCWPGHQAAGRSDERKTEAERVTENVTFPFPLKKVGGEALREELQAERRRKR